jgi:hypothetical protein
MRWRRHLGRKSEQWGLLAAPAGVVLWSLSSLGDDGDMGLLETVPQRIGAALFVAGVILLIAITARRKLRRQRHHGHGRHHGHRRRHARSAH